MDLVDFVGGVGVGAEISGYLAYSELSTSSYV